MSFCIKRVRKEFRATATTVNSQFPHIIQSFPDGHTLDSSPTSFGAEMKFGVNYSRFDLPYFFCRNELLNPISMTISTEHWWHLIAARCHQQLLCRFDVECWVGWWMVNLVQIFRNRKWTEEGFFILVMLKSFDFKASRVMVSFRRGATRVVAGGGVEFACSLK